MDCVQNMVDAVCRTEAREIMSSFESTEEQNGIRFDENFVAHEANIVADSQDSVSGTLNDKSNKAKIISELQVTETVEAKGKLSFSQILPSFRKPLFVFELCVI